MTNGQFFIALPDDDTLTERRSWRNVGADRYEAVRLVIAVIDRRGTQPRNGPAVERNPYPVKSKITVSRKRVVTESRTWQIQQSLETSITTKLTAELTTRIQASGGLADGKLKSELTSDLQSRLGSELIESLKETVATTSSFNLTVLTEESQAAEVQVPPPDESSRYVYRHLVVWPSYWDVYLMRVERLRLTHAGPWMLGSGLLKERSEQFEAIDLQLPLFSLVRFEPQEDLAFAFDDFVPEVENPTAVEVDTLTRPWPGVGVPRESPLRSAARLAFPTSIGEYADSFKAKAKNKRKRQERENAQQNATRRPATPRSATRNGAKRGKATTGRRGSTKVTRGAKKATGDGAHSPRPAPRSSSTRPTGSRPQSQRSHSTRPSARSAKSRGKKGSA